MARKRFTAEQIIGLLREADVKLSQGRNVGQVSRDALDRSEVQTQHQGIVHHRFPLTGIQKVVSTVGLHKNGKAVFSNRPRLIKDAIFAYNCSGYLHVSNSLR